MPPLKPFVISGGFPIGHQALMADEESTIRQRRFRLFIAQLIESGINQRSIAERLHVAQPFISQILAGDRLAGEHTIDVAKREYQIHEDFFSEPDIEQLNFNDFVNRSPFRNDNWIYDANVRDTVLGEYVNSLASTTGALDERRIRMLARDVARYGGKPSWNELNLITARINARLDAEAAEARVEEKKASAPIKHRSELKRK